MVLLQVLTESMVSGGFWLSVVMEMAAHLNVNATVVFVCDDETRPVEAFKDNQVRGHADTLTH